MNTQLSILVKDEWITTKSTAGLMWFVNIFKKAKTVVILDGQTHTLTASKTPYVFDVEPGVHTLDFIDPRAKKKSNTWKIVSMFFNGSWGLASDHLDLGLAIGAQTGLSIKENILECTLQYGDVLRLSCQNKWNGKVKIKRVRK